MPAQYEMVKCPRLPGKRSTELPSLNIGRRGTGEAQDSDVTILSRNDWSRIQCQLNKKRLEEERQQRIIAERHALHELSQSKVKNWTTTVLGAREKKLAARRARAEQEERERVELDIEEAKLQAERRREVIERAKCQLYYETDRVKNFHSALRLSEVLKEREAQMELSRLKQNAEKQSELEWGQKVRQDYLDSLNGNSAENKIRREKIRHTVDIQLAQIDEKRRNQEKELEDYMKEGEEILREAERYKEEEREKSERRAEEARKKSLENRRQIDDQKYMKHIEKLKEEEEDEECRMFAAAKIKMMQMRIQKENEMDEERLERLDRIRERLVAQMIEQVDDEEQRINKAKEEVETRTRLEDEEKDRKRKEAILSINEHRIQDMELKKRQLEEEKAREIEMLKARQEANLIFSANEEEKIRKKKEKAVTFSQYHLEDMEERRKKEDQERKNDLEQWTRDQSLADMDEEQFQDYARRVIEHSRVRGRNVIPMERAAKPEKGGGLGPVYPPRGPLKLTYTPKCAPICE